MLLRLDHPKIFSEIISIISEIVLEVRIKVNSEGMSIVAIDPANVAMVSFKLPATAFSALEVEKEEVLGVSLDSLKSVLRRIKAGSVLNIIKQENMLKLQIQDKIKKEFNLALIEIETEEKEIPNLEFNSKIEMPSKDFTEAIEDCNVVADACSFVSEPDKFIISGKGSLNSFKSEYSSDEVNIQAQESRSKYSLEYLQKIVKATKLTDKITLNFSTDYPLRIDFMTPFIDLKFVLAPRVETDD
jgi:proliferating cell nuclear antigen